MKAFKTTYQDLLLKHLVIQAFQVQKLLKLYQLKIGGIMIMKVIIKSRIISLMKSIDSRNQNQINKIQSINKYFYQKFNNKKKLTLSNSK